MLCCVVRCRAVLCGSVEPAAAVTIYILIAAFDPSDLCGPHALWTPQTCVGHSHYGPLRPVWATRTMEILLLGQVMAGVAGDASSQSYVVNHRGRVGQGLGFM